jgi:hypothetical protein
MTTLKNFAADQIAPFAVEAFVPKNVSIHGEKTAVNRANFGNFNVI